MKSMTSRCKCVFVHRTPWVCVAVTIFPVIKSKNVFDRMHCIFRHWIMNNSETKIVAQPNVNEIETNENVNFNFKVVNLSSIALEMNLEKNREKTHTAK